MSTRSKRTDAGSGRTTRSAKTVQIVSTGTNLVTGSPVIAVGADKLTPFVSTRRSAGRKRSLSFGAAKALSEADADESEPEVQFLKTIPHLPTMSPLTNSLSKEPLSATKDVFPKPPPSTPAPPHQNDLTLENLSRYTSQAVSSLRSQVEELAKEQQSSAARADVAKTQMDRMEAMLTQLMLKPGTSRPASIASSKGRYHPPPSNLGDSDAESLYPDTKGEPYRSRSPPPRHFQILESHPDMDPAHWGAWEPKNRHASIVDAFPDVDPKVIELIVKRLFTWDDLRKLDLRESEVRRRKLLEDRNYVLADSDGKLRLSREREAKREREIRDWDTFFTCWSTYAVICGTLKGPSMQAYLFDWCINLSRLRDWFDIADILAYAKHVTNRRISLGSAFNPRWWKSDDQEAYMHLLVARTVGGKSKAPNPTSSLPSPPTSSKKADKSSPSNAPCFNWNSGNACSTAPCRFAHICRNCREASHKEPECQMPKKEPKKKAKVEEKKEDAVKKTD